MPEKRLGKGIEALINTHSTSDSLINGSIPIDNIIPNHNQPRQSFEDKEMQNLSQSIKRNGILQPLTVRELENDQYELIAGERRFRAAQMVGLKFVPAYVLSVETDVEMMEYALIENIQRVDLNPIEEAEAYAMLSGKYDLSHDEIGKRVGKSRSSVANCLRLLKLPPIIKSGLKNADISAGHARSILSLRKSLQMMMLYQKIIKDRLNVRQTESIVKKYSQKSSKKIALKQNTQLKHQIKQLQNSLTSILGTKVSIKENAKGRGKILIDFFDNDDLDRIIDIITKKNK